MEINGINLDDYYPKYKSYNSVVYEHKKLLEKSEKDKKARKEKKVKEAKDFKAKKTGKAKQYDKCQQCNNNLVANQDHQDILALNNALLEQTLKLAKTLVPVILPTNEVVSPVYYNIKATKKSKKKTNADISFRTYKKEKSKKVVETYRNEKGSQKESLSIKETISYSSQSDTLDELNLNPSLCCTLSDVSENKQIKREKKDKHKHDLQKLAASESFEALATEFLNTTGDTKIKIHLMNETEKSLLAENIRIPLLNAIKEGIMELNNKLHTNEVATVQKFVKCSTQKFENIMEKLSCIDQKLDKYFVKDNAKAKLPSPVVQVPKASTLEQLGEDLLEIKESSGDEYFQHPKLSARRKARNKSAVVSLLPENTEKKESLGGGEDQVEQATASVTQVIKPERPNRLPARFCWTEAGGRKNGA